MKKTLLTRNINKLRTVIALRNLKKINVQMETTLLNWDIAYEVSETDDSRPPNRMMDIEKNTDEISMKEAEIDQFAKRKLESRVIPPKRQRPTTTPMS